MTAQAGEWRAIPNEDDYGQALRAKLLDLNALIYSAAGAYARGEWPGAVGFAHAVHAAADDLVALAEAWADRRQRPDID